MSHDSTTPPSLVGIVSRARGGEIYGTRAFYFLFFCFVFPSLAIVPDNHAQKLKRCSLASKQVFCKILLLGVIFLEKPTHFACSREIPAKMKKWNNS